MPKREPKLNINIFRQRYALPPDAKVALTQTRIMEFVAEYGVSGVFLSFSGGKDSQVLSEIIKEMGPPCVGSMANNRQVACSADLVKG